MILAEPILAAKDDDCSTTIKEKQMRTVRIAGLCLGLLCVIGAVAVASASAAPPEIGRCIEVAPKTGKYTTNTCTKAAKPTKLGNF